MIGMPQKRSIDLYIFDSLDSLSLKKKFCTRKQNTTTKAPNIQAVEPRDKQETSKTKLYRMYIHLPYLLINNIDKAKHMIKDNDTSLPALKSPLIPYPYVSPYEFTAIPKNPVIRIEAAIHTPYSITYFNTKSTSDFLYLIKSAIKTKNGYNIFTKSFTIEKSRV